MSREGQFRNAAREGNVSLCATLLDDGVDINARETVHTLFSMDVRIQSNDFARFD